MNDSPLFPPAPARDLPPWTRDDTWRALARHAPLVLACTLLAGGATTAMYLQQPPVHTTSARVLIQTDQLGVPSFLSGVTAWRESPTPEPVARRIETEMELMRARSHAVAAVDALDVTNDLFPRSPAARLGDQAKSWRDRLRRWFGRDVDNKPPSAEAIAERLLENLAITPLRSKVAESGSNLLEVSLQSTDPVLAARVLDAIIERYLRAGIEQSQRLGEASARSISLQLTEARRDLQGAEQRIAALVRRDGSSAPGDTPLPVQPVDPTYADNRGGSPATLALLRQQLVELQARLEEARQAYTDDHEQVRMLRQRVADVRRRLGDGVRHSARADAELAQLERARLIAQERAGELQRKLDQIALYLRLSGAEAGRVVVDAPTAAADAKGKRPVLLLAGGPLAGLCLGLLLAGLREWMDTRLHGERDVRRWLALPVLGELPLQPGTSR